MTHATGRLAAILLSGTALAGSLASFAKADTIETVTVTAQRREQNILTVPYNITAVSGKRIDELRIHDNAELMRSIPGVNMVDRGDRNGSVVNGIRIRGLNVDSSALGDYSVSAASTVATYVDDTPLFSNFALIDIDRVEVLKGPQGTLYGSGALGGAVRYVMRKPDTSEFSGEGTFTTSQVNGSGSVGFAENLVLNLPLGDTAALRFSGTRFDYPGITDYRNVYKRDANGIPVVPGNWYDTDAVYENKKDADDTDGWYGRAALLWKPSEMFDVTFSFMDQSSEYGGRRADTLGVDGFGVPYRDHESGAMLLEPGRRDVYLAAAEANLNLGFATLTSSTSYYNHHGALVSDNTGFYAQNGWLYNFYYNYPRPLAEADRTFGDKAFTEELRLVSASGGIFDYVIGGIYQNQMQYGTQDSLLRGFKQWADNWALGPFVISDQDYLYRRHEHFTDTAIYGELTWHATDKLQFTGGLRAFWDNSHTHVYQETGLYTFFHDSSDSYGDDDNSKVLFKGNMSYTFSPEAMLYATVSQGYRRGGSNGTPTTGNFAESTAWLTYKPDSVVDYEVGVKGAVANWTYNADIFYVDWTDPQINTATTNWGFFAVQNGKSATTKGLEMQVDGYADRWHWGLGYTYTDAELGADLFTPDGFFINKKGARLPGAPEHMLNGSLDYTQPFESSSLTVHLDGYYQSSTLDTAFADSVFVNHTCLQLDPLPAPCTPGPFYGQPKFYAKLGGFAIFNASTSYVMGPWSATLFVKNIFDEAGTTGLYTQAYMGSYPAQNYAGNASKAIVALPRTVGITLDYKF
jgi:outer membrane receptor protein involved in Fe transport